MEGLARAALCSSSATYLQVLHICRCMKCIPVYVLQCLKYLLAGCVLRGPSLCNIATGMNMSKKGPALTCATLYEDGNN